MSEIKFIDGMNFYPPHENAPDFIKGNIVVKDIDVLYAFLKENKRDDGTVRIDLKRGKPKNDGTPGNLYLALNEFVPKKMDEANKQADMSSDL